MGELEMDSRPFPAPLPHGIPVPFPSRPVSRLRPNTQSYHTLPLKEKKSQNVNNLLVLSRDSGRDGKGTGLACGRGAGKGRESIPNSPIPDIFLIDFNDFNKNA